jgi:ABC-2 type transport system ATP-binding protein
MPQRLDHRASAAVEISALTKRFGSQTAIDDLSTSFHAGELTGLVGPDGAGKTTLMRLMAGLMAPSSGQIRILGLDSVEAAESISEITGYMPQRFGLYEDLSIQENLELYAQLQNLAPGERNATFDRLLTFTRLSDFADRLAGKLSGGMKQKLGLACAMISSPKVLLLDEPGVGVDPVSRQDLWRMVKALTDEGVAVIWATAYLDEAERCDRVILMNEGKVSFEGKPENLTQTLRHRTFLLEDSTGDRRRTLTEALQCQSICDGVIQGGAVRLVLREHANKDELEAFARKVHGHLVPTVPRFEDGFIDLLGGGPGGVSALAQHMSVLTLDAENAVECRNLTKRFGAFTATDQVTFAVPPGQIFGLLGPNGAGKSTTFKMLCGLLKATEGEALVAGIDLRTATSRAKSRLGYMAQKFSLYGLLSVRQNLEFSAGVYGLDGEHKREKIQEMVDIFHLEKYLDSEPNALPLGYKQRLALACAVMHNPPVLFLDEPTSGVDPITRREFWTHINGMVQKGVTVLVTTHFMDEAEYCDRVALMYQAQVIAMDTPDALKAMVRQNEDQLPSMEETFIRLIEGFDQRTFQNHDGGRP